MLQEMGAQFASQFGAQLGARVAGAAFGPSAPSGPVVSGGGGNVSSGDGWTVATGGSTATGSTGTGRAASASLRSPVTAAYGVPSMPSFSGLEDVQQAGGGKWLWLVLAVLVIRKMKGG